MVPLSRQIIVPLIVYWCPFIPGLSWNTRYTYKDYWGDSPITFDSTIRERVDTYLRYNRAGLYINLAGGYDIYNLRYLPVSATLNGRSRRIGI